MNAANRVLWIAIGLLLTVAGVLGALASLGRLPGVDPGEPVLSTQLRDRWLQWGPAALGVVAVAGFLLVMLGLWLLAAQLRRRGGRTLPDLVWLPDRADPEVVNGYPAALDETAPSGEADPDWHAPRTARGGRVRVESSVLGRALTLDLQASPGIDRASARLTGHWERPKLLLRLVVTPGADLAALHEHVEQVLQRFATTTGLTVEVEDVAVRIGDQPAARVG